MKKFSTTTPNDPDYMIHGSSEPLEVEDGLMTHQEFLTVLKNKDCHECPLYKRWGIEEEDDESICYIMHHLEEEINDD